MGWTPMFFDPSDYLPTAGAQADSERDAEQQRRSAVQRAKLCEATTRLAARGGLEAAAIHLTARRAGIGQGTYYKLYDTKEACLREAFERCADTVFARVADAAAGSDKTAGCIEAGLGELLDLLADDPDVAHLLLGGILAGDLSCRAARERARGRFTRLLAGGRDCENAPPRCSLAWLAAAAIASTLALWLDRDDAPPKAQMFDELVRVASWVQGGAAVERLIVAEGTGDEFGSQSLDTAQRSRQQARQQRARRSQRERILAAMVETAGTNGYKAARLSDVLKRAELSVPLFYTHFSSKEECLLAAFDATVASILERVRTAVASVTMCAEKAEAGLRALVESLAEQPATARLVMVEVRAAGKRGEERYGEALISAAQLIAEPGVAGQANGTREVARMVAQTAAGMIAREVGEGRAGQLEGLLPELVFTVLAPYLGGEKAAERADAVSLGQAR